MHEDASDVICIVGPTASGKTDVAQLLALALDGEVVSADSMQIYRYMDIGTGKLPPESRVVPHYCLDLVDPGEPFSAALFQMHARSAIRDIQERGKRAILAGGTGFYVRATIDDYVFPAGEQADNPLRDEYQSFLDQQGKRALWDKLNEVDSESAAIIHPNNTKRVMRALELASLGESYANQVRKLNQIQQKIPARFFGLAVKPAELNGRIEARVDNMREQGLVDEVEGLVERGFEKGLTAPQAIGYKEIVAALKGLCSLDQAFDAIKVATRRYAKRQRTWFRKDARIEWLEADTGDNEEIVRQISDMVS